MNDLQYLYQKPISAQLKELKGNAPEAYDTLEELADKVSSNEGPLILEGTVIEGDVEASFIPASGFPTSAEIIAAYNSGRPVYQKVNYDNNEGIAFSPVAVFYSISEEEYFVNFAYDNTSCRYQLD